MAFYRRRLPHWIPGDAAVFVTWRLAGSRLSGAEGPAGAPASVPFSPREERLDYGPFWLQDCRIAGIIVDALRYGESIRRFYHLHAWVIMPNHVHVILQPRIAMSSIMRWLKGRTARLANRVLEQTGKAFWQDESFDHWIRSPEELGNLIDYVENNPVKAGLAGAACEWPWSSAAIAADGASRD